MKELYTIRDSTEHSSKIFVRIWAFQIMFFGKFRHEIYYKVSIFNYFVEPWLYLINCFLYTFRNIALKLSNNLFLQLVKMTFKSNYYNNNQFSPMFADPLIWHLYYFVVRRVHDGDCRQRVTAHQWQHWDAQASHVAAQPATQDPAFLRCRPTG